MTRFELATFWSVARRSIQLSYTYTTQIFYKNELDLSTTILKIFCVLSRWRVCCGRDVEITCGQKTESRTYNENYVLIHCNINEITLITAYICTIIHIFTKNVRGFDEKLK